MSNSWKRAVARRKAVKVKDIVIIKRSLEVLQWSGIDLHEQIVPCKKITKMSLTFLQSLQHLGTWKPNGRDQLNSPPQESPQAWNLEPKPLSYMHPPEPVPTSWFDNIESLPLFIFITETFMLQFVVRKLGALGHLSGRYGEGYQKTADIRKLFFHALIASFKSPAGFRKQLNTLNAKAEAAGNGVVPCIIASLFCP